MPNKLGAASYFQPWRSQRGTTRQGEDRVDWQALAVLWAACAVVFTLVVGRYANQLGRVLGLLDFPDLAGGRKRHDGVTPLIGGSALAPAVIVATLLTAQYLADSPYAAAQLEWLAGVVLAMFVIGVADDRFALGAIIRLISAMIVLLLVILYAPDFDIAFLRFAMQPAVVLTANWGEAFTLVCLVGLLNAVNMADGKNGVVIGLGLIWSVVLWFRLPPMMLPIVATAIGALAVLFWFNLRGRLFLGDGGSYAISALFGLLAIAAYNHDFATVRADDIAVMFAIPVFDTIRLMAVRLRQRRSPFEGDRNHLHHHLHRRFGWPRGLWIYLLLAGLPNLGAVLLPHTGYLWLFLSFIGYLLVFRLARHLEPVPA